MGAKGDESREIAKRMVVSYFLYLRQESHEMLFWGAKITRELASHRRSDAGPTVARQMWHETLRFSPLLPRSYSTHSSQSLFMIGTCASITSLHFGALSIARFSTKETPGVAGGRHVLGPKMATFWGILILFHQGTLARVDGNQRRKVDRRSSEEGRKRHHFCFLGRLRSFPGRQNWPNDFTEVQRNSRPHLAGWTNI